MAWTDDAAVELVDGGDAEERHAAAGFVAEDAEGVIDAGFTGSGEAVEVGAADHAGVCAEGKRFDDVCAAADAAVEDDFGPAADGVDDGGQGVDRGGCLVELAAAVVGDDDGADAHVDGADGVVGVEDPFDGEGAVPGFDHPFEVGPGDCGVELVVDVVAEGDDVVAVGHAAADDVGEGGFGICEVTQPPVGVEGGVEDGAGGEVWRQSEAVVEVAFSVAVDGDVDGEAEDVVAGVAAAVEEFADDGAVAPDIDLKPAWSGTRGGNVFN